jgi:predicted Zn-dependent protease
VEVNPAFAAAREELAHIHFAAGQNQQAIEQLEALAALEPSRPERLVTVGLAYARIGRTEAAILTLGRAAERYPDAPAVYTALGRVWLEAAERRNDRVALGKAVEALQPATAGSAASSEALMLYGRALFLSGQYDAAERALQQAVARQPVEPLAFRYLADASERVGRAGAAYDALTRYVALVDEDDLDPNTTARLARLDRRR